MNQAKSGNGTSQVSIAKAMHRLQQSNIAVGTLLNSNLSTRRHDNTQGMPGGQGEPVVCLPDRIQVIVDDLGVGSWSASPVPSLNQAMKHIFRSLLYPIQALSFQLECSIPGDTHLQLRDCDASGSQQNLPVNLP